MLSAQPKYWHYYAVIFKKFFIRASLIAFCLQTSASQICANEEIKGFSLTPRSITLNVLDAPRGKSKLLNSTTWGEIDVIIEALPSDLDPRQDYITELEVKIFWLTPEPNSNDLDFEERQVFSITQNFSHVKPAKQLAFVAYIPPDWVDRFGGTSRFRGASNIAVQVIYKGKAVIETEMRERGSRAGDDPDWFKDGGKNGVLLPIQQSPWMMENWDRYYRPYKWSEK